MTSSNKPESDPSFAKKSVESVFVGVAELRLKAAVKEEERLLRKLRGIEGG